MSDRAHPSTLSRRQFTGLALGAAALLPACRPGDHEALDANAPDPSDAAAPPDAGRTPDASSEAGPDVATAPSPFAAVWANSGLDKVLQSERRVADPATAVTPVGSVMNACWDGTTVRQFGARNERVMVALVLEAGAAAITDIDVTVEPLAGPGGASIRNTVEATGNGVFDFVGRPVEVFYARYLEVRGLDAFNYQTIWYGYDERGGPRRLRRPCADRGPGVASPGMGTWADRPLANKRVPDALVPAELARAQVAAAHSQMVYVCVYIPKGTAPGVYRGAIAVAVAGARVQRVPFELEVRNITLPDAPSVRTAFLFNPQQIARRFFGEFFNIDDQPGSPHYAQFHAAVFNAAKAFQRRKIGLVLTSYGTGAPAAWIPSTQMAALISGSYYVAANGYDGPGVNTNQPVQFAGPYGTWRYWGSGDMWTNWNGGNHPTGLNAAVIQRRLAEVNDWYAAHAPATYHPLYLEDEPAASEFPRLNSYVDAIRNGATGSAAQTKIFITAKWSALAADRSGVGGASLSRVDAPSYPYMMASDADRAAQRAFAAAGKQLSYYNGGYPGLGANTNTTDDGVGPLVNIWATAKARNQLWFSWHINYWNDENHTHTPLDSNVWKEARTFGGVSGVDPLKGETGYLYTNGDGVMCYPGRDTFYPDAGAPGVDGVIASVRMECYSRGIQDGDYIALARAVDATRADAIVARVVPVVGVETPVQSETDPTFTYRGPSWDANPDVWQAARKALADLVDPRS